MRGRSECRRSNGTGAACPEVSAGCDRCYGQPRGTTVGQRDGFPRTRRIQQLTAKNETGWREGDACLAVTNNRRDHETEKDRPYNPCVAHFALLPSPWCAFDRTTDPKGALWIRLSTFIHFSDVYVRTIT